MDGRRKVFGKRGGRSREYRRRKLLWDMDPSASGDDKWSTTSNQNEERAVGRGVSHREGRGEGMAEGRALPFRRGGAMTASLPCLSLRVQRTFLCYRTVP